MSDKFGKISQVIGPVVDVSFEGEGTRSGGSRGGKKDIYAGSRG